jgi:uncharacterized protein (DUF2141 family)
MLLCLLALPLLGAEAPLPTPSSRENSAQSVAALSHAGTLDVHFTGLRSTKGMVRACLTRNPKHFPQCQNDPQAVKASVAAGPNARMQFTGVPAGEYALTVLHDENSNFRADMLMGIPREGVGFSRNPVLRFGPPRFEAARFSMAGEQDRDEGVTIKYFL